MKMSVSDDAQNTEIATLKEDVAMLKRIVLTGNGHPPLTERVAGLERALATQTWLLRAILGAAITGLAGQVIQFFR